MEKSNETIASSTFEEGVRDAYSAASELIKAGKENYEIRLMLMDRGFSYEDANTILYNARKEGVDDSKGVDSNEILSGILWLGGGILITALTYDAASAGGYYIVAYGPIIYGAIKILKGLF